MAFILAKGKKAFDPEKNAQMQITGGPQIEYNKATFNSPIISLAIQIEIRRKFPDQPLIKNDPRNPCVMITSGVLDMGFRARKMQDIERNTELVLYLVRMIAFINKGYPLATSPFLWSDYEEFSKGRQFTYRMPSDEELLKISMQPE
jgi:hypothetical protein